MLSSYKLLACHAATACQASSFQQAPEPAPAPGASSAVGLDRIFRCKVCRVKFEALLHQSGVVEVPAPNERGGVMPPLPHRAGTGDAHRPEQPRLGAVGARDKAVRAKHKRAARSRPKTGRSRPRGRATPSRSKGAAAPARLRARAVRLPQRPQALGRTRKPTAHALLHLGARELRSPAARCALRLRTTPLRTPHCGASSRRDHSTRGAARRGAIPSAPCKRSVNASGYRRFDSSGALSMRACASAFFFAPARS